MDRRKFIKGLAAGITAGVLMPRELFSSGEKQKPNIVLILIDDLGWADTACYGSKYYETPNIDRLARQGMKFSDAYAACAVCSPTRASVMTGRYPARIGITDWIRARFQGGKDGKPGVSKYPTKYVGGPNREVLCPPNPFWLKLEEVTIAEILKTRGYKTCHIGKWHLGPDAWYPDKQGFDYNIGGCDYGQPPGYFDPYTNKRLKQGIPTLKPRRKGEFLTDRAGDEAVNFIRKCRDIPFFLYMATYAVHTPLQGKKDLVEKYRKKPKTDQKNPTYAAMVESVDDAVGKIMDALEKYNLDDDTLVFFSSDNGGLYGYSTSNKPLRSGKGFPYEGGIREPFIVRWPGRIKPNTTCSVPVCSIDFLPTICEAANVKIPRNRTIDGTSIMPLLKQTGSIKKRCLTWHFPHYRGRVYPYSIIRDGDWKLIKRYAGPKRFELFNLKNDLSETTDLSEKMVDKVKELNAKLMDELKKQGAKIPRHNPAFHLKKQK